MVTVHFEEGRRSLWLAAVPGHHYHYAVFQLGNSYLLMSPSQPPSLSSGNAMAMLLSTLHCAATPLLSSEREKKKRRKKKKKKASHKIQNQLISALQGLQRPPGLTQIRSLGDWSTRSL
jgi:hypothetical protein